MSELIEMYNYCCTMRDDYAAAPDTEENTANARMCDLLAKTYEKEIEVMANE